MASIASFSFSALGQSDRSSSFAPSPPFASAILICRRRRFPPRSMTSTSLRIHCMSTVSDAPPPVSETKLNFLKAYKRPIPSIYNTVVGLGSRKPSLLICHSAVNQGQTQTVTKAPVHCSDAARVIDGKAEAKKIRDDIAIEVSRMKESIGVVPGLAVILVGDRKDSASYVRNKKKACKSVGINSFEVCLPEDSSEEEVLNSVSSFNHDPSVHGILVQLPLPSHMDEQTILNAVSIEKDVDGFHPLNMGRLAMRGREPLFVPCTPKGCIELLHRHNVEIKGKRAVVIGRSNIVGMPAALLLQREDATVSIIHSRTKNPEEISREADIIIAAVGKANMVRGSWIKPGAVIIDVGINHVEGRLVGDVCYEEASKVASAITPVPGGVGPMTIAMLLSNTLTSAKRIHNFQ